MEFPVQFALYVKVHQNLIGMLHCLGQVEI